MRTQMEELTRLQLFETRLDTASFAVNAYKSIKNLRGLDVLVPHIPSRKTKIFEIGNSTDSTQKATRWRRF